MKAYGDEDIIKEIAKTILEEGPQIIASLAKAIIVKNPTYIRYYGHKLQGMARHIGAMTLLKRASCVESAGYENDIDKAASLFGTIQSEFEKLASFLSQPNWLEIARQQQSSRQAEQAVSNEMRSFEKVQIGNSEI